MNASIISEGPGGAATDVPEVAVVGGGAAGLATAIFAARGLRETFPGAAAAPRITVLDGARKLGAKILVSGGSRCNVTNRRVEAADFWRPGSPFVKQVLRAFPVPETVAFFKEIGVELKEEALGKLFPVTNKSRTVLDALLAEARRREVEIVTSCRVQRLQREATGWKLETSAGPYRAQRVILATGGLSLPKTGSDGLGYSLARAQGHTIVPTVPALEPLVLGGEFHVPLSGIAHEAEIRITRPGEKAVELRGSLLWTHFGISGPLALNASRFMRRAKASGSAATLSLSFAPDLSPESLDLNLLAAIKSRPHQKISTEVARECGLAQALAQRIVTQAVAGDETLSRLTRERRRDLVKALLSFPLDVVDGRGYNFAEVTSGGIPLGEVNPKTMESRLAAGLYFVGEILDVDGRIGGFNFQWAWATAKVAGRAVARPTR